MLDHIEMSKLSDQELQNRLMNIEKKLGCPMTGEVFELMSKQREYIMNELQERQQMAVLRNPPIPAMSLTDDELSRKEKADEEKNRQSKDQ
jgi:hypothetical protein